MPKPKAHGHRQPHARTGSSTSVVKLAALTPAHRQDSAQRLQLVQAAGTQGLQQPPKKSKQNGRHHAQGAVLLQPAARRPATPPPPPAPARQVVESPSSTTEDEWESSESGAVTPNPEPEPEPAPAPPRAPADVRPALPPSMASDVTVVTAGRPDDEPSPATPKPAQKPPLLDTAIALLQNAPSSAPAIARQQHPPLPPLLASPAITPPPAHQAPQALQSPAARRPRPQSAIFPAGAAMTPLVPSRRDPLDDDARARHRHSASSHRHSLQPGAASTSRPLSVHSIAAFPASRPHPLLRGMSHSGASVGPLLTSDPAHATLSPNPASQPSSPNSERSRPGASSSMSISGRLLRRTSQSSIKSVATLPATSTVTALSTSPSASSTAENVNGTFGRARNHSVTGSASAAVSSLAKASKSVAAPAPLWQTTVTFKSTHQYHPDTGGAFDLLASDVRARHATVAKSHAPGIASFQRVVAQRMALSKRRTG